MASPEVLAQPRPICTLLLFLGLDLSLPNERTSGLLQMMAKNRVPLGFMKVVKWKLRLCYTSQITFMSPIPKGRVHVVRGSMEQGMRYREARMWMEFCFVIFQCVTLTKFSNLSNCFFIYH